MKYKKLTKTAIVPRRAFDSAGYDLFSDCDDFPLFAQQTTLVGTGIAVAIPEGYVGLILPRSGLGHKKGIVLGNLVGVIDADYRGELKVSMWNRNSMTTINKHEVKRGSEIGQLLIVPVNTPMLEAVDELPATSRGSNGFGSTMGN